MDSTTVGGRVLLVDANEPWRRGLGQKLARAGRQVQHAANGAAAVALLKRECYEVIVLDLELPDTSGMDLVCHVRSVQPDAGILVLAGCPSIETAVASLRHHVSDYLAKPQDPEQIVRVVESVAQQVMLRSAARKLPAAFPEDCDSSGGTLAAAPRPLLLGQSEAIRRVKHQIDTLAPHDITVLVQGETGTGKDLVARLLHARSPRAGHAEFCKVNCPGISETLFESEMFGYERGAFTGAHTKRMGRFEIADGGTLFLDEIALLSIGMQAKLLEAIEYKSFYRVGGNRRISVDVRIVSATNTPLHELVAAGEFRHDLYYRLYMMTITLPPLRERSEDIPLLAEFFLERFARRFQLPLQRIPERLLPALVRHSWPGNVRELESLLARFAVQGDASSIENFLASEEDLLEDGRDRLQANELRAIRSTLERTGWNQREAARQLHIGYSALRRRIQKYGLERRALAHGDAGS